MAAEDYKQVLAGKQILIAEDQVIPAMSLEVKLRYSGVAAIRICDRLAACLSVIDGDFVPDAAIVDVDIAGKDGRDLARELKARGIPFLFHTGSEAGDRAAQEFSGVPLVRKPSTEQEVVATLASLFRSDAGTKEASSATRDS